MRGFAPAQTNSAWLQLTLDDGAGRGTGDPVGRAVWHQGTRRLSSFFSCLVNGQHDRELASLSEGAFNANLAAVSLDDVLACRKAESGSALSRFIRAVFGTPIRLEDFSQRLVAHPGAKVADRKMDRLGIVALMQVDQQSTAFSHRLAGVDQ